MTDVYQLSQPFEDAITVAQRRAVKLKNVKAEGDSKRASLGDPLIWFDTASLAEKNPADSLFARVINSAYTGVIVSLDAFSDLFPAVPDRMKLVLKLQDSDDVDAFRRGEHYALFKGSKRLVVSLDNVDVLNILKADGLSTCYHCYVDDAASLQSSIYDGMQFDHLSILFRDPTNIPLELVIASLQQTGTFLIKEIADPDDVDDAIVVYGVMEYGAEGVAFSPRSHAVMDEFLTRVALRSHPEITLQVGRVVATVPVGMGFRACIDTVTLFNEDEGMLVGSTSQGGVLCCPEVFFLPYMELRPFRVNAGAMHSYVYNINDRTDYMSELKAGSPIMIVNSKGCVRTAAVGRMKIEQRPLRLIEVKFDSGQRINVVMQDDWHVRIFSADAKPLNISTLKPDDRVLGYVTESGRHVGIKIDENILEK